MSDPAREYGLPGTTAGGAGNLGVFKKSRETLGNYSQSDWKAEGLEDAGEGIESGGMRWRRMQFGAIDACVGGHVESMSARICTTHTHIFMTLLGDNFVMILLVCMMVCQTFKHICFIFLCAANLLAYLGPHIFITAWRINRKSLKFRIASDHGRM